MRKNKKKRLKRAKRIGAIAGALAGAATVSTPFLIAPPLYGKAFIAFMAYQGAVVGAYIAKKRLRKRKRR